MRRIVGVVVFSVVIVGLADLLRAGPVRAIPNLESITFFERSGGSSPTPFTFAIDGSELTARLADPLGTGNADMTGVSTEFYDVYYSNADGAFNLDGEFLSIEGVFLFALPNGGGLNLAEMQLNFTGSPGETGNFVASFLANGDNGVAASAPLAIDGDLLTHTTMGNTIDFPGRLRVTLGFLSSSGPPPDDGGDDDGGEPVIPLPAGALQMLPVLLGIGAFYARRRWLAA